LSPTGEKSGIPIIRLSLRIGQRGMVTFGIATLLELLQLGEQLELPLGPPGSSLRRIVIDGGAAAQAGDKRGARCAGCEG
jgi:hypothetical protein